MNRPSIDHLNVAQSGALITDVADQVDYLTQQLQTREDKYSYKEDWKILTFLIGGNDLCLSCVLEQALSPDKWEERMRTILTKVKQQIPRVIVNVVPIFKVSQIVELTKDDAECQILHKVLHLITLMCMTGLTARYSWMCLGWLGLGCGVCIVFSKCRHSVTGVPNRLQTRSCVYSKMPWHVMGILVCFMRLQVPYHAHTSYHHMHCSITHTVLYILAKRQTFICRCTHLCRSTYILSCALQHSQAH